MVALTYNEYRREKMLDVQGMISELGVPIAMSLAMMWGCFYLIKYITGQHTTMMNTKFEYLTGIIVKLIDQQKLMQIDLKEWSSNTKTLVDFLTEERDKEQQRLIARAKKKDLQEKIKWKNVNVNVNVVRTVINVKNHRRKQCQI